MIKALAVLRTVYLVFIVGYTVRAMPWAFNLPSASSQAYDMCRASLTLVQRAAWLGIAWIAFETAVGWFMATRKSRPAPGAPKGGEPPFAPPPHG